MADSVFRIRMIPLEEADETIIQLAEGSPNGLVRFHRMLYLKKGSFLFECPDTPESGKMMETLNSSGDMDPVPNEKEQFFQNLLERKTLSHQDNAFGTYGGEWDQNRMVLLFKMKESFSRSLAEIIRSTAPMEKDTILVPMRFDLAAMIRSSRPEDGDDAAEYAMAVIETLEVESGIKAVCGIGNCKSSWQALPESYEEAREALKTAEKAYHTGKVFRYKDQFLERLLSEIPPEEQKRIKAQTFTPEIRRFLNEEIMETLRVFFQNDLNISTASRQLFIHRNTLQYRLDKIKKLTGLDLRRFTDATTFFILLNLQGEKSEY